ncbi:MAG: tetratricopeptide repeat protein [Bacteroidota bacterium]
MEELIQITKYLQNELGPEARRRFETRLASDEDFAAKVAEVRSDLSSQQLLDWLDGLLPADEADQLSKQLEVDPQLRQQLQQVKEARLLLSTAHQNRILEDVEQIASQEAPPPRLQKPRFRWLQVAAVLLLLLALGGYTLYLPTQYSNQALYAQYIEYYPGQGALMTSGGEQGRPAPHQQALKPYDQGDYEQALSLLQQVPASSPYYNDIQFYLANTHLALGQAEAAVTILQDLLPKAAGLGSKSRMRWYLALAHLGAGQLEEALVHLEDLQQPEADRFYQRKAEELLSKLNSSWRKLPGIQQ